jgi:uncharacterized protein
MQRHTLAVLAGVSLCAVNARGQDLAGVWAGGTNATGHWYYAQARLTNSGGTFEVVGADAAGLPVEGLVRDGAHVQFRVRTPLGVMRFDGSLEGDVLAGTLAGAAPGAEMLLMRTPAPRWSRRQHPRNALSS